MVFKWGVKNDGSRLHSNNIVNILVLITLELSSHASHILSSLSADS